MKKIGGTTLFLLIALLLLFACKNEGDSEDKLQAGLPKRFVEQVVDNEFNKIAHRERLSFVNQLFAVGYENPADFANWLNSKADVLFVNLDDINENDLFRLNTNLFQANFYEVTNKVASATLAVKTIEAYPLAKASAVVNKLHQFILSPQKDSLRHYLDLIKHFYEADTLNRYEVTYYTASGVLKELEGLYFEAVVNYSRAKTLVKETDTANLFLLNHNLSCVFLHMNFADKAMHYANMALEYVPIEKIPNQHINTFATIFSKNNKFDLAQQFFMRAIDYAEENNASFLLAQAYANFGNLKRKEKNFSEALRYVLLSDSICNYHNLTFGVLVNQINQAEIFFDAGNFEKAKQLLEIAAPQIAVFDIQKINMEYFLLASKIYEALENQILSDRFFKKYIEQRDTYLGDLPRSIIAEWELAAAREVHFEEENKLNSKIQAEVNRKYILLVLLLLLVVLGGGFYFVFHKRALIEKQVACFEREKMTYELELKSKELLSESLNKTHISNTKMNILHELDSVLKEIPTEHQKRFRVLQSKLRTATKTKFSEEFEKRFVGVYEEFYEKLKITAPELSPTELKVCGLIRLNISSKDIALLTNRSLGTVENTRINIRKKLNIEQEVNLQHFLLNL